MKVILVAGARPNFMKIAPIMDEMRKRPGIKAILVHTGQHYDEQMSKVFFHDLHIPRPDRNLNVGSSSHAAQTAKIMTRFEPIVIQEEPDLVMVVGDVNSTVACALTSVKLGARVAHVESGLRSFDRTMPEEINRVLTDAISDYLFTTEESANDNLIREGVPKDKIFFVGNTMIDTIIKHKRQAEQSKILERLGLTDVCGSTHENGPRPYGVLTVHRPSNVDDRNILQNIVEALVKISDGLPIIFPCHPRTQSKISEFNLERYFRRPDTGKAMGSGGLYIEEPYGYIDFLRLMGDARIVFTDSGGIQEETTALGVPCVTLRDNTERPSTVMEGTNRLAGTDRDKIIEKAVGVLEGEWENGKTPRLWDGRAAERIVDVLIEKCRQ